MENVAINQILILVFQCLIVGSLLLFLFRLRTIFGLGLIFTALGVFQYLQVFLAASLYIEVIPGILVTPGSMVMFTGSLFTILLIYIREDAIEARKVIYALLAANFVLSLLQIIFSWAIEGEHVINIYQLPKELFLVNSRVLLVGTLVLFIDSFLVIFIYEAISRIISPLLIRILFSMAIVLSFDSLLFSLGAFAGTNQFSSILVSGLLSKLSSAIIYSLLFSFYLIYMDKRFVKSNSNIKVFKDVFHLLTYRQKYEQVSKEMEIRDDELQDSEMRFKSIIEHTGDAMFLSDFEGHIIDVNNYACESLSYTRSELLSLKLSDLDHAVSNQGNQKQLWDQLKPGIPITLESLHQRKDGSLFPVELRIGLIEFKHQKSIIITARNISERKIAESNINDQVTKWQTTFNAMSDSVSIIDLNGKISQCNKATLSLLNISEKDLKEKKCFELVHDTKEFFQDCPLVRMKDSQQPESMIFQEEDRWLEVHVDPIFDSEKKLIGAVHVVSDITERKQAEKKLRDSDDRLELFFSQSLDGFFFMMFDKPIVWDETTDKEKTMDEVFKHQRITKANKAVLEQYKATEKEFIGLTPNDLFAHDLKYGKQVWTDFFNRGQLHVDTKEKKIDGSDMIIEGDYVCMYDTEKRIIGHFAIQRDVTETRRAETKIQKLNESLENKVIERTSQLEHSNQELREFAQIVSHDLKAPLRAISQLSYWISQDYADKIDEEGQEKLAMLIGRVKRLDGLIEGILQYSKAGRQREKEMVMDLHTLVEEAIISLNPPSNIAIIIENKLPKYKGDPTRLGQLFQNLIDNAIKFMDKPKGEIKVGCRNIKGSHEFYVSDNGPGIEEKYFDRIFQIFQRLESRDNQEGTGVGLSLVKRIVQIYGGKIWLESKQGKGTTFYFTLPHKNKIKDQ